MPAPRGLDRSMRRCGLLKERQGPPCEESLLRGSMVRRADRTSLRMAPARAYRGHFKSLEEPLKAPAQPWYSAAQGHHGAMHDALVPRSDHGCHHRPITDTAQHLHMMRKALQHHTSSLSSSSRRCTERISGRGTGKAFGGSQVWQPSQLLITCTLQVIEHPGIPCAETPAASPL